MVYCPKCGTQNKEDAKFCVKCGAELYPEKRAEKREEDTCFGPREKRVEEECFGIPHGGAIVGIIAGVVIILIGMAIALGVQNVERWIWPFILVVGGLLIIIGAIYGLRRRQVS